MHFQEAAGSRRVLMKASRSSLWVSVDCRVENVSVTLLFCVSDVRDYEASRNEVILSLLNFITTDSRQTTF